MAINDAVTDFDSSLYLYPVGAWGIAVLFAYSLGDTEYALGMCYPLSLWWIGVSIWWARKTAQRVGAGRLTADSASQGVEWIGHTLAGVAGAPAIIFLAADPLEHAAWATTLSVIIVSGLTYGFVSGLRRVSWRGAHTLALVISCIAMPLNASTAIGLGFWLGLFKTAKNVTSAVVPL